MPDSVARTACPGCGLALPGSGEPFDARSTASVACRLAYGDVAGFELARPAALGRWHQLLVDTYAAQHVGPTTPRIGPAFALIGLHLALDRGWDGIAIRDAHQALARRWRDWPAFIAPRTSAWRTVGDVPINADADPFVTGLLEWAADVWAAWSDSQPVVRELTAERLDAPPLVRHEP